MPVSSGQAEPLIRPAVAWMLLHRRVRFSCRQMAATKSRAAESATTTRSFACSFNAGRPGQQPRHWSEARSSDWPREFVRTGDTVRRPATELSASVQLLLIHFEEAGCGGAPRFLGTEPDGSTVLSWVEGWVPADAECWRLGAGELASVGELLGSYHDCVAGFAAGSGSGFAEGPQAVGSGQVVRHSDIAPFNCNSPSAPPGCFPAGSHMTRPA